MMQRHDKKLATRQQIRRYGFLAAASMMVVGLSACEAPTEDTRTRLRSVRTVTVNPTSAGSTRTFSGISKSQLQSRMSFKVAGTVQTLPIEVGDTLRRGQLIARLDDSLYDLQAQQAEASLVQAQAAERNASAGYERVKGLYADNNASRNDLDTARANAESAEAQVKAAAKALELARLNVSYTRLTAAVDCNVATVEVEVNENVSTGTTIATVNCGSDLEVELSLPEGLISRVQRGMPAIVRFDTMGDTTLAATVSEVGVTAGGSTAFPVTVSLVDAPAKLRSGLAAEVSLEFPGDGAAGERFLVPLSALVEDAGQRFVYVLEEAGSGQGTVRRRDVQVGQLTEKGMEVFAGLKSGEQVISAGTSLIRDGLTVATGAAATTTPASVPAPADSESAESTTDGAE